MKQVTNIKTEHMKRHQTAEKRAQERRRTITDSIFRDINDMMEHVIGVAHKADRPGRWR